MRNSIYSLNLRKLLAIVGLVFGASLSANAINLYSFANGDWGVASTWTTDPTGLTLVGSAIPGAADNAFIINGKVITNNSLPLTARSASSTKINPNSTLDLGAITGYNLGTVSGTGLMRLNSLSFPLGTFTAFVAVTGGTIEYYDVTGSLPNELIYNNLKLTNSTASAVDYDLVNSINPINYTINGDFTLISTGAGATNFKLGTVSTNVINFNVAGDIDVQSNTQFGVGAFNAIHNVNLNGNFTNSGTVLMSNTAPFVPATNGASNLKFTSAVNTILSAIASTNLYTLIVDKGLDPSSVLIVNSAAPSNLNLYSDGDALQLINGTVNLGVNANFTRLNAGGVFTIPSTSQLFINGASILLNGSSSAVLVDGKFRISNGAFSIGNEGLLTGLTGLISIDGGTSTVEKLRSNTTVGTQQGSFTMNAGILNIDGSTAGTGSGDYPRFSMAYGTQSFYMTGGTINISNPETGAAVNGGILLGCNPGNFGVTGGTINATIPASSTNFNINSSVPLFNLNIFKAGAGTGKLTLGNQAIGASILLSSPIAGKSLIINQDLIIVSGNNPELLTNNFDIAVKRNFSINVATTYTPGTNNTILNGTALQYMTISGTVTAGFYNLTIDKPLTISCFLAGSATAITVLNDLSVLIGTFGDVGRKVNIFGNVYNTGFTNGLGGLNIVGTGAQTINGNGAGRITTLIINKTSGSTTLTASQRIEGVLRLVSGILDIDVYRLDFFPNARIYDNITGTGTAFSNTKMVRTFGISSGLGIRKQYNAANPTFTFPVGSGSKYTPATLTINGTPTTYGFISVRGVNNVHPIVTASAQSLKYYWRTNSSGFNLGAATVTHNYVYDQVDVVTGLGVNENEYVPAVYNPGLTGWISGSDTEVDETTNTVTIDPLTFGQILDGEYTAGDRDPNDPFAEVITFYSIKDGNWEDVNLATTPWSVESHVGAPAGIKPGPINPVLIGDGVSHFHYVTCGTNTARAGNLLLSEGSTLDVGSTFDHNFAVSNGYGITGSGLFRISSPTATVKFPAGDFGLFLQPGGGKVEYYTTTVDFTIPTVTQLPTALVLNTYNSIILTPGAGRKITMPNIDLTINAITTVQGNATGLVELNKVSAKNINCLGGFYVTGGTLSFMNDFPQTITLNALLQISNGATFNVASTGTAVNNILNHKGSTTNFGTLDFNAGSNRVCDIIFSAPGSRTFSGTNVGAFAEFNKVTLNSGSSQLFEVNFDYRGTLTAPTNNWLTLSNGTLKLSRNYTLTLTDQANQYVIPSTAKLWVNYSTCIVNIGMIADDNADLLLIGKLQIDAGTVNIGVGNKNNDIEYSSIGLPELELNGTGALFVNGQIRRNAALTAGSLIYKQTGTSSVVINGANSLINRAKLEIENAGSVFTMSDNSTLRLIQGGGTTFGDLYVHAFTNNITGGTIICQPGTSVGNQIYTIDAVSPIFNLTVNGVNGSNTSTALARSSSMIIKGSLNIATDFSVFDANGIDISILGNLTNSNSNASTGIAVGGFRSTTATQLTTFAGNSASQQITGLAGNITNFANLKINNIFSGGSVSLSANTALRVNSTLTLTSGMFNDGGNTITSIGDINNFAKHVTTAAGKIICQGTVKQFIGGNGQGQFGNLTIDNIAGVSNTSAQRINNILDINNGSLFIDAYALKLSTTASVTGAFSGSKMIQTNGLAGDSGVVKFFTAGANNFLFPIGTNVDYTPAEYNITASSSPGSIRVAPVRMKHPATSDPVDRQLNYYWSVQETGLAAVNLTHQYTYLDAFVSPVETNYVAGRYVIPQWVPTFGIPGTVNAVANTITLTGVNYINGDYTAGESTEFDVIDTLYSRNATLGGDWDDVNTWSAVGHGGPPAGITPTIEVVIIAGAHTVDVTANNRTCSVLTNDGILDLNEYIFNVFGYGDGAGLLRMRATPSFNFVFPTGNFNNFTSSGGGTVEYYGTVNGTLSSNLFYNNLVFSDVSNKTLGNINITVNGDLTINGGVVSNAIFDKNISIRKNWVNNTSASAFDPGLGTISFVGASQNIGGAFPTTFNNFEVAGSAIKTLTQPMTVNNDLTISSSFDVSSLNSPIDLKGNFINNGGFNSRAGLITLNGSSLQTISGTSNTSFYDLTLNNLLGAQLLGNETMLNTLNPQLGTFNCGFYVLTLKSTLTRTARVAALNLGDIIGNITMERLAPGPFTGWAILATPINSALINQWTDDFPTSGFVGSAGSAGGFISIYTYSEFDLAPFGATTSYNAITNANLNPITPGVGYWTYLGTGAVNTANIAIDVTGTPYKGNIDFGVSFSSSGSIVDDGFNMVGNPYPSAIDWDNANWTKTNIDNAIYIWQADLAQYATYIGGVSTNGGSNLIASSQGFYVKANAGTPVLQATENVKVSGNPTFIKSSNSLGNSELLRIGIAGNNFKDEAIIRFNDNASVDFDNALDGFKLYSDNLNVPSIGIVNTNKDLSINTLPSSFDNIIIPFRTKVGAAGNYELNFDGIANFPEKTCLIFEDLKTGFKQDLKSMTTYAFNANNTNSEVRFIIHMSQAIPVAVVPATCSNIDNGVININNSSNVSTWKYLLNDANGNTVKSAVLGNENAVINNVKAGSYQLVFDNGMACSNLKEGVTVDALANVNSQFETSIPVDVSNGIKVNFTASETTLGDITWNFGDGVVIEGGREVAHTYATSSNYNVTLSAKDGDCNATNNKSLTLTSSKFASSNGVTVTKENDKYFANFNFENTTQVSIKLIDALGHDVAPAASKSISNGKLPIVLDGLSSGVYFVKFTFNSTERTEKLIK